MSDGGGGSLVRVGGVEGVDDGGVGDFAIGGCASLGAVALSDDVVGDGAVVQRVWCFRCLRCHPCRKCQ